MTQDEALKIIQTINKECDEHDICQECPVWSSEHNECLMDLFCYGENGKSKIKDSVNQPAHYLKGGMECIDVIKAAVSNLPPYEAVCVANILKYVWRYNNKNGIEDLRKAKHYLEWLIESLEG